MTTSGMHRRPFEGRHLVLYEGIARPYFTSCFVTQFPPLQVEEVEWAHKSSSRLVTCGKRHIKFWKLQGNVLRVCEIGGVWRGNIKTFPSLLKLFSLTNIFNAIFSIFCYWSIPSCTNIVKPKFTVLIHIVKPKFTVLIHIVKPKFTVLIHIGKPKFTVLIHIVKPKFTVLIHIVKPKFTVLIHIVKPKFTVLIHIVKPKFTALIHFLSGPNGGVGGTGEAGPPAERFVAAWRSGGVRVCWREPQRLAKRKAGEQHSRRAPG